MSEIWSEMLHEQLKPFQNCNIGVFDSYLKLSITALEFQERKDMLLS